MSDDAGKSRQAPAEAPAPALEFADVGFAYAASADAGPASPVLAHADFTVPAGAFCLLVGPTGSGKSTLLRLVKPEITPAGTLAGSIRIFGHDRADFASDVERSARTIGFVFQDPESQIVCDSVWHEMAFGLEGLGVAPEEMRQQVAQMSYFFGIEPWFRRRTAELSGGQKQVLALASALVMRPRLVLLDEPASMLDPVATRNFLSLLFRINRELGITVVVATHAPAVMADYATMALGLAEGADGVMTAREVPLEDARAGQGRKGAEDVRTGHADAGPASRGPRVLPDDPALCLDEAWFRYHRDDGWVLRGASLDVAEGEVRALVGGNGSGKSTMLALMAGTWKPLKGHVRVTKDLAGSKALLPQAPKALLSCESVGEELMEWSAGRYGEVEARALFAGMLGMDAGPASTDGARAKRAAEWDAGSAAAFDAIWRRHPYDLSGGQQELLALAKLLLCHPRLLLLDEPTQGLDDRARASLIQAVRQARDAGATIIVATHDLAFCQAVADRVSMLFDGEVTSTQDTATFLEQSWMWRP